MQQKIRIIILTIIAISSLVLLGTPKALKTDVLINEVRSWDVDVSRTGYYGSDYIELYNKTSKEISLDGWYMSDDETDLKKSRLSDVVIGPNDYAIIFANHKGDSGDSVLFKINPQGEKIFLSDSEGNLLDSVYVPKQELGTVYARITDGADEWTVKEVSIGASNNEAKICPARNLLEPLFSHESGFYEDEFKLIISVQPGERVYYTLDGSIPNAESMIYEDGIQIKNRSSEPNIINSVRNIRPDWKGYGPDETPVDKAVVVRAMAMNDQNGASEIVTKTYFVGLDKYKDRNVMSVTAEYEDLFGDEGIFVTGKTYDEAYLSGTLDDSVKPNIQQSGRRWEVPGNIQILEQGKELVNQKAGLRIQGASSRNGKKKRIGIYAREEYSGSPYLEGLMLEGQEAHSYTTNLENPNAVLQDLLKDRFVDTQSAMEVDIFLNGEYYYTGYLLEKYSKYFLNDVYGVAPDNVMIVKDDEVTEGPEFSREYYEQMVNFAKENDLSISENYKKLSEKIDMNSFIDYMCANIYICNMDVSEKKNYMLWRTIEEETAEAADMRWRWMMYDVDSIFWNDPDDYGVKRKYQINSFSEEMIYTGTSWNAHPIFLAAKENKEFCQQFVLTFMDLANNNFSLKNVEKVFSKWNVTLKEYDNFFKHRYEYIVPYMAEEFQLTGTLEDVTLKVNDTAGGKILLNTTIPDLSEGSWTGRYYTDYPVKATAIPNEGYEFIGWGGSIASESVTIEADVAAGGITLEAIFEKQ